MRRVVLFAALIAVADQLTKWLVVRNLVEGQSIPVITGLFNLVRWHNTGAAWGIFQDRNWILTLVSLLTILALFLFRHSFQVRHAGCATALGLIAGGIVGNLIDRVQFGHVVDFLDFYIGAIHWPAFNVADSAICVGVGLYLIASWLAERQAKKSAAGIEPPSHQEHQAKKSS